MTYRQQLLSGAMSFIIAKKEDVRPGIVLPLGPYGRKMVEEAEPPHEPPHVEYIEPNWLEAYPAVLQSRA